MYPYCFNHLDAPPFSMNLPNKLTVSRFLATGVFLGLAAIPASVEGHLLWWKIAYLMAIVAGFTDILDGYIARKYDLVTDFGKLIDPLADKVFTVGSYVTLVGHELCPAWIAVVLVAREFGVTGLRSLAAKRNIALAANNIGKAKTTCQMLGLVFGGALWVGWLPLETCQVAWTWTLYGVAAFTAYSGWSYFYENRQLYMQDT
ncbi:MAG TPA: CDP-diacylglycerol--glycerol-3-phosphate 3-phosphatidyltransferase [Lentisphaeria bacterium]|nr:CDP-diacylglycerol--glycerol-3-phosphate 3-phosphatidyltransferase [Lentisphaeria bacterium]